VGRSIITDDISFDDNAGQPDRTGEKDDVGMPDKDGLDRWR